VTINVYWLSIIIVVAILAWIFGRTNKGQHAKQQRRKDFSRDYLVGLNYLLSEQPDKAVDIFTRLLEVDSDTIETHLALGHLFRRRGEVERAIRIHQNLIARPQLTRKQRTQAMVALGQDYLRVGVLDRAERLLLDVVESGDFQAEALSMLLEIYQQEKEWEKAIQTAEKLQQVSRESMHAIIAQYNCELATETRRTVGLEQAQKYLKRAISIDKNCVRASLMQGEWDIEQTDYKAALKQFKRVTEQDAAFISEIIQPTALCYEKLNQPDEYIQFLYKCLDQTPRVSIILALSEISLQQQGIQAAADFVAEQLYARPSLYGLSRLIELQKQSTEGSAKYNLQLLYNVTQQLIKQKPVYRCGHCGYAGKILDWQCPSCHHWATIKPIQGIEGE
jgi:lipopolysaccharide biosynthesis regulator YciM